MSPKSRVHPAELLVGEPEARCSTASGTDPCLTRGPVCQKALKRIARSTKRKGDVGSQPVCSGLSAVSPVVCQSPPYTCLIGESAAESLGLFQRIQLGNTCFKHLIKIFCFE